MLVLKPQRAFQRLLDRSAASVLLRAHTGPLGHAGLLLGREDRRSLVLVAACVRVAVGNHGVGERVCLRLLATEPARALLGRLVVHLELGVGLRAAVQAVVHAAAVLRTVAEGHGARVNDL